MQKRKKVKKVMENWIYPDEGNVEKGKEKKWKKEKDKTMYSRSKHPKLVFLKWIDHGCVHLMART